MRKKVITFQRTITKKGRHFFKGKNRVTPSVTALGDTNCSEATALMIGAWSKRRQTKTAKVKTATFQNGNSRSIDVVRLSCTRHKTKTEATDTCLGSSAS